MPGTVVEGWELPTETTREVEGLGEPMSGDVVEQVNANLGYDVFSGGRPSGRTTLLSDEIWRDRILRALREVEKGRTRPIEEYWAESDAEDDE